MMNLQETQAEILAQGQYEQRLGDAAFAAGQIEQSQTHYARAKCAREQGLLWWTNAEVSDPNYAMEHQALLAAADHYRLVRWGVEDPTHNIVE
jgi:hypothetical protein